MIRAQGIRRQVQLQWTLLPRIGSGDGYWEFGPNPGCGREFCWPRGGDVTEMNGNHPSRLRLLRVTVLHREVVVCGLMVSD